MKVCVTGGAGFIGSHVADAYLAQGHKVTVLDDLSSGNEANVPRGASFVKTDIVRGDLEKIFKKEKFDAVNHHAAQIDVRKSVTDPALDAEINVVGGLRVLQCCEKFGVKKVIFSSTGGALYGEQETFPADEDHPKRPCSPYGIDKLAFEHFLEYYAGRGAFDAVSLRYANVYGPRQNPHGEAGVVAIFVNLLLEDKTPVINGDGGQTRDFVYVEDIAAANVSAMKLNGYQAVNIGTGVETDINTLFRLIRDAMGLSAQAKHGPQKPGEQRRSVITFEKAKKLLGWQPRVSVARGIQKTVEWFQKRALQP